MSPIAITDNSQVDAFPVGYAAPRGSCRDDCQEFRSMNSADLLAERKQTYTIAQIGADGIGPEVINAGVKVVNAVAKKLGTFKVNFTELDWSSDRYKKTGSYVPADYLEILKQHDAIL